MNNVARYSANVPCRLPLSPGQGWQLTLPTIIIASSLSVINATVSVPVQYITLRCRVFMIFLSLCNDYSDMFQGEFYVPHWISFDGLCFMYARFACICSGLSSPPKFLVNISHINIGRCRDCATCSYYVPQN